MQFTGLTTWSCVSLPRSITSNGWKIHIYVQFEWTHMQIYVGFNPVTAKLFNLNFHPLEVVSSWRDPQLQVSENYSDLTKWRSTLSNLAGWCYILPLTYFKCGTSCADKKLKPEYMRHRRLKVKCPFLSLILFVSKAVVKIKAVIDVITSSYISSVSGFLLILVA